MPRRAWLVDLAGFLLLAWAGLIAYVSVPTLVGKDPLWDGGVSLVGAVFAAAHAIASVGVWLRAAWGRALGLVVAVVGTIGTSVVLLTLAASALANPDLVPGSSPFIPLLIPAGMAATYVAILIVLLRSRSAFRPARAD